MRLMGCSRKGKMHGAMCVLKILKLRAILETHLSSLKHYILKFISRNKIVIYDTTLLSKQEDLAYIVYF